MDVIRHFGLKHALFRQNAPGELFISHAFETARDAVVEAVLACEGVVLTGAAGMGKSQLLGAVVRELSARGVAVASFAGPALAAGAELAHIDALVVDEADTAPPRTLAAILSRAAQHRASVVLAVLDPARVPVQPRAVHLSPMSGRETADFLVDAAAAAGRPDLFTAAAQEALVEAVHGNPRVLRQIANVSLMEAMFEGGNAVEQRHVVAAIAARLPLPPAEPDYVLEAPRRIARVLSPPEPIVVAVVEPEPEPEPAPMRPMYVPPAPEPRRRLGARGVVAATGALGLLLAAAILYAIDTWGLDRIAAMLRLPIPQSAPREQAPLPASAPAPGFSEAALAPAPSAEDIIDSALPLPALTETMADGTSVVAPPVPDWATPGYRPPSATLPTISAAVRAGIANPNVGRQPSVAGSLPQAAPTIGETAPLAAEPGALDIGAAPVPEIDD